MFTHLWVRSSALSLSSGKIFMDPCPWEMEAWRTRYVIDRPAVRRYLRIKPKRSLRRTLRCGGRATWVSYQDSIARYEQKQEGDIALNMTRVGRISIISANHGVALSYCFVFRLQIQQNPRERKYLSHGYKRMRPSCYWYHWSRSEMGFKVRLDRVRQNVHR